MIDNEKLKVNITLKEPPLFSYVKSDAVSEFRKAFKDYAKNDLTETNGEIKLTRLRTVLLNFFSTYEFKQAYYKIAQELSDIYDIPTYKFIIQPQPTPRVSSPGQHGTSWHTDYWYGHGEDFRTVWVPLLGVVPGSTFDVVERSSDNKKLLDHYSSNPDLLAENFDLMGSQTHQVLPDNGSAFVFSSRLLHGSPLNTSQTNRISFDFRFGSVEDSSSTKDLSRYLKIGNNELVPHGKTYPGKYLKYIRGGCGIDPSVQHILVEGVINSHSIEITGQEAEIERYGQPMFRKHLKAIEHETAEFIGIAVASKSLLDHDILSLISNSDAIVYCVLEGEFLSR
ncbi:MAG: hypothetical protein CMI75_08565 [Candidatus Pelagibacter sp.]|nr:hypothetical protein [Candidatus Pelagibacter sp.]